MEEYILHSRELAVGYGRNVLVRDVEISVRRGEIVTLIGPNGAGKSTLLKTITRQIAPLAGTIYLSGRSLTDTDERTLSRTMSILMTERVEPELMTCRDVVSAGRYPYTGRFGVLSDEDRRQIDAAMELVHVSPLADRDFNRISDGQRQRVMLARAICQQPRVLVLDEPTSYLDIRHKLELLELLRTLAREREAAVVMTLHELELAKKASDRLVCVKDGAVDRVGTPEEIFSGGYIRRLYDVASDSFGEVYGYLEPSEEAPKTFEHYIRCGQKTLRCGYTTGACAALAAAGAARLLLCGKVPETVALRTPKGLVVDVAPEFCRRVSDSAAECGIRKDAGDDPDITDGVIVTATVEMTADGVVIDGGAGVGRVTKPGLDQPVGAAAINRVPRRMIEEQARQVCAEAGYVGGLRIVISIPGGEALAERTFNPQLGVVGGLSVLGTSGVVEPMSEQALLDTITVSLRQAYAEGRGRVILTPGNYGEDYLRESGYDTLGVPTVKYSNFIGDALDMAAGLLFRDVLVVGHIGKLVKLAGGIMNTHSRIADCRTELFCAHAAALGADAALCRRLLEAATADACLALLRESGLAASVTESLLREAQRRLDLRVRGAYRVGAVMFSNEYGLLGMTDRAREILADWKKEK